MVKQIKQPKQRAKNLEDADIESIVVLLDGWTGRLTWELLIEAIASRFRVRYTRQALDRHARIKQAFQLIKGGSPNPTEKDEMASTGLSATEAQVLLDRYGRLEIENARLKFENERLLEQFVVWAYNANIRGLDKAILSKPLPPVDREPTKISSAGEKTPGRRKREHGA